MAISEISHPERSFVASSSFNDLLADLTEKERQAAIPAGVSRREPVIRTISVPARGEVVLFKCLDSGGPRPSWFMHVLRAVAEVVLLPENWDGEGASKIDKTVINRALAAIDRLLSSDAPVPSIVPLSNSGLQFEWHRNERDLEIEFTPNGEAQFYYFDENTDEEREGPVGPDFTNVEGFLDRIR